MPASAASSSSSSVRILVADDQPVVCRVIARLLRRRGWAVEVADGGPEALRLLRDQPFQLLLTDVQMPGMNGVELVRQARVLHPSLPVLYMTGCVGERVDPSTLEDPVLQKPFASDRLYRALEEVLGTRTAAPKGLETSRERGL